MAGEIKPVSGARTGTVPVAGRGPTAVGPGSADPRSTPKVIGDIVSDAQTLLRKEIELGKLEIMEAVNARLQAAAAAAVAGVLALFALGFGGSAVARALELVMPAWLAWLIVTLVFVLIAVAALLFARKRVQSTPMEPKKTKRSIEETRTWATRQIKR